ncbi:MAG TPA: FUSC family protein, partial [Rhodanobacteraceae bacterium]
MTVTILSSIQLATRASIAAALALAVAERVDLDFPIYAMIAAVIVTDLSPARTRELAWPRLAGTVLGAATGAALSMLLPAGPLAVGVAILVTMLLSTALRFQNAARLAAYVCGIVILDHH